MLTGQTTAISAELSQLVDKAGEKIASAIHKASGKTGVDFSYLLQQAKIESSFKTDAKALTSSATGLYQFLDKTWLSMVEKYGDKHGICDNKSRQEILNLRKNPEIASMMAAEFASENKAHLEKCTSRAVGATELYMAHFMGAGGATKFINALDKNPNATAANLFPDAARANKNVFYDKDGGARSLKEVYAFFDNKFTIKTDDAEAVACAVDNISPSIQHDDLGVHNTLAALSPYPMTQPSSPEPLYHRDASLFTNDTLGKYDDNNELSSSSFPRSLFAMLSPVDVLELMKDQFTGRA